MRICFVAVPVVVVLAGCSGRGDGAVPGGADTAPVPTTTTSIVPTATTTTTVAVPGGDQQTCDQLAGIEARGFATSPQELMEISSAASASAISDIAVLDLLETCQQHGLI